LRDAWEGLGHVMLKRRSIWAIRNAALGLFHGRTVYEAYAPYPAHAEVVHDVHLGPDNLIDADSLGQRLACKSRPVELIYIGRVHPMKGPKHWIDVIEKVIRSVPAGCVVHATWYGGGALLDECRALVVGRGLSDSIRFPGPENRRDKLMSALRAADLFMFCHLTPESPRCLIEALMSGVPLLGFDSAYARDLVARHGGGEFVAVGDVSALAAAIVRLIADRDRREQLTRQAVQSGALYSDVAVFAHRSELVKRYLN
jgi:glycosyltransferase involved in cell wall biosynthesis